MDEEIKTMEEVFKALRSRNDALAHARDMEARIVEGLIKMRAYHLFTVNWRRLITEANREAQYQQRSKKI